MNINEQNIELLLLKNIDKIISQKAIAKDIGHSAGKVNYVLKALVAKGFVKAENFKNSKNRRQYKYLLTQEGIKRKIQITQEFIKRKKEEYDMLQDDLKVYQEKYGNLCQL